MPSSKFSTWNTGGIIPQSQIDKITKEFDDSDLDEMVHAIMKVKHDRIFKKSAEAFNNIRGQTEILVKRLENYKDTELTAMHKSGIESQLKLLIESIDSFKTAQQSVKEHPDRI